LRYSCGHVSTKKNVRGINDATASTPPQLRSSRCIRYRDNIGYPRYGESYNIGDNQYSSKNLSYCPINRFLELVPTLRHGWVPYTTEIASLWPMVQPKQINGQVHVVYVDATWLRALLAYTRPWQPSQRRLPAAASGLGQRVRPEGSVYWTI
jgi:hypothetical protein